MGRRRPRRYRRPRQRRTRYDRCGISRGRDRDAPARPLQRRHHAADRPALSLDAGRGDPPVPVLAAYGSLLCTAAYASAQNGRRHQALDLIAEAAAAATRMPDRAVTQTAFSPTGVEVYQIGICNALGESAAALTHARAVVQAQLPTPERRARFCIDTARAWHQHGRPDQAYRALLAAERHGPEEIRRASVRTLITAISQGPGPPPYGLRQLAGRAGVPS
jgi:hypothetical protein